MIYPDIGQRTATEMARTIDVICNCMEGGSHGNTVQKILDKRKITYDDYRLCSTLGMPAIRYQMLYARTRKHYAALRRQLKKLVAYADKRRGESDSEVLDTVLSKLTKLSEEHDLFNAEVDEDDE